MEYDGIAKIAGDAKAARESANECSPVDHWIISSACSSAHRCDTM
jgi:hypothetical protein